MNSKVARMLSLKVLSTFINSSRQFVACAGDWVKKHPLLLLPGTQVEAFAPVGCGIIANNPCAVVWLAANAVNPVISPLLPTVGQSVPGQMSLKLPPRSAIDGTGR